jgi:hypothetical protein
MNKKIILVISWKDRVGKIINVIKNKNLKKKYG